MKPPATASSVTSMLLVGCMLAAAQASQVQSDAASQTTAGEASAEAQDVSVVIHAEQPVQRDGDAQDVHVAVLGFNDRGPSVTLAPLRNALSEMLAGDLSQYQGVRVVERARVERFLSEFNLGEAGLVEAGTARRAGEALTADYIVFGDFRGEEDTVSVDVSLFELTGTQPLGKWTVSASSDRLFALETKLLERVLAVLGHRTPARRQLPAPKVGPSPIVAVLPLWNLGSGRGLQEMESGFSEILQANLSAIPQVRLVERAEIERLLTEQSLASTGLLSAEEAIKIGKLVGAERLVYGSFLELNESLRIDVRLTDVETASLLMATSSTGSLDDFAAQLEQLTLEIVAALSVSPPENAKELVRAAVPKSKLEATVHFFRAGAAFRDGRFADAARDFERALLVDPDNLQAHYGRVASWYNAQDYKRTIVAGQQAFTRKFPLLRSKIKMWIGHWVGMSYWQTEQYDEFVQLCDSLLAEFPHSTFVDNWRFNQALSYLRTNRAAQGAAIFQQIVDHKRTSGDEQAYGDALRELHRFHGSVLAYVVGSRGFKSRRGNRDQMAAFSNQTLENARNGMEVYDLILEHARGKRGLKWARFAQANITHAPRIRFLDGAGRERQFLSRKQQEQYYRKGMQVFGWVPGLEFQVHHYLAPIRASDGDWEGAEESYRYLLEHPGAAFKELLPSDWDTEWIGPTNRVDQRVEAHYQLAKIQLDAWKDEQAALEEYQTIVRDYGVTRCRGQQTAAALEEHGETLEFPDKCALVWGGGANAQEAWETILEPLGYKTHCVGQYLVTAAHLAPYDLVVLVRTGTLPYQPTELFALRSFVATGGSLLCVVSPGWERAAPGIHNPLLAFFGARADQEYVRRAESTRIVPHPITSGIESTAAKCCVDLEVPPDSALIQSEDKTILAAFPYRHGKVVLASYGQWFLPATETKGPQPIRNRTHWTARMLPAALPPEKGNGLQLPLLNNVLKWLLAPPETPDERVAEQRQRFVDAQMQGLRYQFRRASRQEMMDAVQRLVDGAGGDFWQEEALWAAGEASRYAMYFPHENRRGPEYWYGQQAPPEPQTEYYQRLLESFAGSPLLPYAQWRLAECERFKDAQYGRMLIGTTATHKQSALALFEQVEAPSGSFAWAWTKLASGRTRLELGDFQEALAELTVVADQMPNGPEKSYAMQMVGSCYVGLGKKQEARRYFELVRAAPDIVTWPYMADEWLPVRSNGGHETGSLHYRAQNQLDELK